MERSDRRAVNPVVGTILMIAIVAGVIGIIFAVAIPQVRRLEARSQADTARAMISRLNSQIVDLTLGGSARSTEVSLHFPAGGVVADGPRTRWVLSYSAHGVAERLNFTVENVTDGDDTYTVVTRGLDGLAAGSDTLRAEHTVWRGGQPVTLDDATFTVPAQGDGAQVQVTDDGTSVPLRDGRFEVVLTDTASDNVVGTGWILDSASVLWRAQLHDGFHRVETVHGALVVEAPGRDVTLTGFNGVRTPGGSVSISSVRLRVPDDAAASIGAGQVVVPLRAEGSESLVDARRGNVTLGFHLAHRDLLRDHVLNATAFTEDASLGRVYIPGPVPVSVVDHLVALPEGVVRS